MSDKEFTVNESISAETHNVKLWIKNDSDYYDRTVKFLNGFRYCLDIPVSEGQARQFVETYLFPSGLTPDNQFLLFVDWKEIAKFFNEFYT